MHHPISVILNGYDPDYKAPFFFSVLIIITMVSRDHANNLVHVKINHNILIWHL